MTVDEAILHQDDYAAQYCQSNPGASPLEIFFWRDPDATRRLLQLILSDGVKMCDLTPHFAVEANSRLARIPESRFTFIKRLIDKMKKECEQNRQLKESEWTPILYIWECYSGQAQGALDIGDLIWTDKDGANFLMVNLMTEYDKGPPFFKDFNAVHLQRTHRFFNFLHYLPMENPIGFLRSTYVSWSRESWTNNFLAGVATASTRPPPTTSFAPAPIMHLNSIKDLVPSLHKRDLRSIDSLIRWMSKGFLPRRNATLVLATPGEETTGAFIPTYLDLKRYPRVQQICLGTECFKYFEREDLRQSGGCYLTFYCSQECQKSHWKRHKVLCQFDRDS